MHPVSWQGSASLDRTFSDGTTNTIMITEKYSRCGTGGSLWGNANEDLWQPTFAAWSAMPFQTRPTDANCDPKKASTSLDSGILVGLADGSGRNVAVGVSPITWWSACTPSGGEVLNSEW